MSVPASHRHFLFSADKSLISLHHGTRPSHRCHITVLHGFPDAVTHEPGRLISDVQHAHKLMAADALLAAAHELIGQPPLVQRDMAAFEDRAYCYGEFLAARPAPAHAWLMRLALHAADSLRLAADGTNWAVRPADGLEILPSGGFIVEYRVGEIEVHGRVP